jgi:hypothetical protein
LKGASQPSQPTNRPSGNRSHGNRNSSH